MLQTHQNEHRQEEMALVLNGDGVRDRRKRDKEEEMTGPSEISQFAVKCRVFRESCARQDRQYTRWRLKLM